MEKKVQEDGSQVRDERIERGSADSVCVHVHIRRSLVQVGG